MRKAALWVTGLILFSSFSARATEGGRVVTLDQVIDGALKKSVGVSQVHKEYEDKLASSKEASVIDNPELKTDFEREKGTSGTGISVELTQPFKVSHLTGARWRYATMLRKAASTEQQYDLLKIINETTSLYMRLWLLQERKQFYTTSAGDAETLSKLVKASAKEGQTSTAASLLFAADADKLTLDVASIDADLRQVRADLTKLTGQHFGNATLKKPHFSKVPEKLDVLVNFAKDRANLRNIVKAQVKVAEERVSIARQDAAVPEIGPRLLYSRLNNGLGYEKAYGVGIQLRIPLWNQNDAERQRANADLTLATSQADILSSVPPEVIIEELQHSAIALAERAENYSSKILPGYRKSYEVTRTMFHNGQINALEVWQVREKLYQTENEAMQAVAEAFNARGALELELGGKLEEIK